MLFRSDQRRWAVCKAGNEWVDGNYSLIINEANVGAYLCIGGGRANSHELMSTTDPLVLDQWTPVALTYDGRALRVYCNGEQVASADLNQPRTLSGAPLSLGGRQDRYSFFEGDLDEVCLYDRALSAEEIRQQVHAVRSAAAGGQAAPRVDGLVAHWGFDDLVVDQEAMDRVIESAGLEPPYRHLLEER